MSSSFSTQAIVLKRSNIGETDRLVTILSQDRGKIVCVAKGVRKLKSSNRANLEPGNCVKAFLIENKGLPLLTQTRLLQNADQLKLSLTHITQLSQILEIFDRLFVEGFIDEEASQIAFAIYDELLSPEKHNLKIKNKLNSLVQVLGYQDMTETLHRSILDYVAEISEKKMKSVEFLRV
jgi:DNA repair protein RecO (recombination protein O)